MQITYNSYAKYDMALYFTLITLIDGRLADEETVCITNADFTRLQELFRFNGIPHYETITPDCRRVRDDLQVQGFYNFDYELKRLKEKLK